MMRDPARRRIGLALLGACAVRWLAVGCSARAPAPEVAFTLLDGSAGSLVGLRGKVLLVNFWATSCAACVAEMPALAATHERYAPRGFDTLAVAMRHDPPALVARFVETRRLPFGVVIDHLGEVARAFGDVVATPTSFLVDRRGQVAQRIVGAPDIAALHAQVEQLLAEPLS